MDNVNQKSFIATLSSFNKELFHSRAIAWLLNEYIDFRNSFLSSILPQNEHQSVSFIKAIAEIRQIDILLVLKRHHNYLFIHVENKIKASESEIQIKKGNSKSSISKLSQTEYYYSRLFDLKFRKDLINEIKKELSLSNISLILSHRDFSENPKDNWKFIFLKPSFNSKYLNDIDHLNKWRKNIWGEIEIENPWTTKSYEELIYNNLDDIKLPTDSVKEYIQFLKDEFTSKNTQLRSPGFLNFKNISSATCDNEEFTNNNFPFKREDLNTVELSTLEEWFHVFERELNKWGSKNMYLQLNDYHLDYKAKFITETGNNGGFLIEAFYILPHFSFPSNHFDKRARIGLQYEHNSSGHKLKFFFAAYDYAEIKIRPSDRKIYNSTIKEFLSECNFKSLKHSFDWEDKFNGSKGKSFCSKSRGINCYKNFEELMAIFKTNLNSLKKDLSILDAEVLNQFLRK
jgi:hypothetical protein